MANDIKRQYINTPFSYTKKSAGLSLLQQAVLNKVSAHLQHYIKEYFGSELSQSREIPRPLFSKAVKAAGIEPIHFLFSEFNVEQTNYPAVRAAIKEAMSIHVTHIETDENGKLVEHIINIFDEGKVPLENQHDYMTFFLNPKVVDEVFDMSQGYITHPENIALMAEKKPMPMMYYLLRHKMLNLKLKEAKLTVFEIKDYLGYVKRDLHGNITNIQYNKFSQFEERVLAPSMADIDRLFKLGEIDAHFTYECKYRNGRKRGDPDLIIFKMVGKQKPQKEEKTEQSIFDVVEEQEKQEKQSITIDTEKYSKEWQESVDEYQGMLKDILLRGIFIGTVTDGYPAVEFTQQDEHVIKENWPEWQKVVAIMKQKANLHGPGVQLSVKKTTIHF